MVFTWNVRKQRVQEIIEFKNLLYGNTWDNMHKTVQVHTRQNSSIEKGGDYEQPSIPDTLLESHEVVRELFFFKCSTLWVDYAS